MNKLLDSVMDLGEQMLINGGEVHRVEDSLKRIFSAYNAERTDVFIITSSMVVTVHDKDGNSYTQTRRITDTGTDFEKLHRLNELSRKICSERLSAEEIKAELDKIPCCLKYPLWLEFLCYALISGIFTLSVGGGIAETVVSFLSGVLIRLVILACEKSINSKIFAKFISAFLASAVAYIAFGIDLVPAVDRIIIGNIMTLVPGIGITNALRDLLVGDSMAGLLRTIEAVITALAITAGYFAVVFFTGGAQL